MVTVFFLAAEIDTLDEARVLASILPSGMLTRFTSVPLT